MATEHNTASRIRKSPLLAQYREISKLVYFQPELYSRGALKKRHTTLFSSRIDVTAESGRSASPAAAWWNREQLPAVEGLWALSLKSALPYLENQHWDLVPDLPHPREARPAALTLDVQWWCDFSEEVAAFPEPFPPSPRTSSPDRFRLSYSQQDLSAQTRPEPQTPDRQLSSHSRQSHDGKTASLQALTKRPRLSLHSREEAAPSAGASSGGGEEGRKGGEAGPVNRELLTDQVRVYDSRVSQLEEAENKEEVQNSVKAGGGEGGGQRLQSCPMCLLEFPVGFTQMDCDGHLAQCLSEMNVDVTW
ncbi:uncharacterized protein si:ch73-70k4.1 [Micropterus dolomieu]|uniref:uncharacterized protein si:ch73-70k4.1 n=1 Tax=Micropterus dolomieu TaxID=147949 RepID=UPI001E8CABB0|nr:uncharacterized protein si:ch73-70k4.1 [Micropterus dolomieu]